jgi:hypothetical protein
MVGNTGLVAPQGIVGVEDCCSIPSYRDWIASLIVGDAVRVRHVVQDRDVPGGRCMSGAVIYRSAQNGSVRVMVRYDDNSREVTRMFEESGNNAEFRLEQRERPNEWQSDEKAHRYESAQRAAWQWCRHKPL